MTRKRISSIWFLLWVSVALAAGSSVSELADLLIKAHRDNRPIPILSDKYPELDIRTAYLVQRAYVQRRLTNDQIAGFKAGLTSEESQTKFNVDFPVAGVLFSSGKKTNNSIIEKSMFKAPMIETEIGFVVGKPITYPLKNISQLYESIQAVMPVIELPDLGFADMKKLKAVDIIAANVSSAQFIVGEKKDFSGFDLNNITVILTLDGETVNQGKGIDTLGDQRKAALWLINKMVEQGWEIEPGHLLITGVLGKMIPGKPGKYTADYRSLGRISFEIR
jgi:2-keto-4-pentenoate hydratase